MGNNIHHGSKTIKLVYIIGRYPELTDTFIDREIATLRQSGDFQIKMVSIRYPLTLASCSPEQQAICRETLYLIPQRWADFDYLAFVAANLWMIITRPLEYLGTLIYLLRHPYPNFRAWLKTIFHFWQGVYTAYLLRQLDFDHLHAHFMDRAVVVALVVSRFLNKSYSLTAHAADIYATAILTREKIVNARFAVTVSHYNKEYLLHAVPGVEPERIHVLHPWVDPSHFKPPIARPTHARLHILSVGRLVEKKGHADLIEACHLLRLQGIDLECRIVGEGPLRSELEERTTRYGLQHHVHLIGGQPQSQVQELLRTWADVFALPCIIASDGDRDGIPVALAEAMAMELPVISTDIVGIRELVQVGTGILVPPQNPAALAEALQTIGAQDPSTRLDMGRRGRAVVDAEFNLQKGTKQLAGIFQKAVAQCTPEDKRKIWPALH